ncbi:MAG: undecaprenyl diphosphate synthase family protein [Methanoregulaceae archaeon]
MIYRIYEWLIRRKLERLPECVCFMITADDLKDVPEKLYECVSWCRAISREVSGKSVTAGDTTREQSPGIRSLTFHISTPDPETMVKYLPEIRRISEIGNLTLLCGNHQEKSGTGMEVTVAIGTSGREEIANCIRKMAEGGVRPDQVDESLIDSYLTFRYTPDIVIKTGGDHLTDFLIWQSVYSELYFSDINWKWFRYVDLLRILRDYQSRARRFGK